jgi:hypothetical protein
MSTANGHGLVDPERRGKPVSLANKGRRVRRFEVGDWLLKARFDSKGSRSF